MVSVKMRGLLLAFCFIVSATQVKATPKHVIIIRHAEKIPGENHLDQKGFERAAALAYYFSGSALYNNPPISHVFAAGLESADSSLRPIQTCTPTANHYNLNLNIDFKDNEPEKLARELLTNPSYDQKTVLICWSHGKIHKIVQAMGGDNPGWWNKDIFDQVFFLTFDGKKKPTLKILLQKLMFGDRVTFKDPPPALPSPTKNRVDEDQ